MPRRKEYNRQKVLEKATYLFWEKGYKSTSMTDIVEVTKLNSASLYKEFGGKDGLFEAALQYYSTHIISTIVNRLIDDPNIKGIKNFLEGIVNLAESKGYMGCLVMNHLTIKDELTQKANQQIQCLCLKRFKITYCTTICQ
ncbi:MAG: TetR/AcrR family transcriptional regulator [Maribacter sp.]|nr:TetR/AcrR family transcriptional regulator [Maribacter sp.]